MKIVDERETQTTITTTRPTTKTNKDRKEPRGAEVTVKGWQVNNFVVHLS